MRREEAYLQQRVRVVAGVVLAGLLVFYTWFAFRDDGRLMTVPGMPRFVWYYFDHHANIRNGVGFLILGAVGAAAVMGLRPETKALSLVLCLSAPLIKDMAQFFTLTRHFNWDATALGIVGALLGWCGSFWLVGKLVSAVNGKGKHEHQR
jgi:hypothetical protein